MSNDDFFRYLKEEIKEIKRTQIKLLTEVAGLKVKSGVWGLLAGALGSFIVYFIKGIK